MWRRILFLLVLTVSVPLVQAAPDGAKLFAQLCAACHGDNGGGGVGIPLRLPAFQSSVPDSYLQKTIRLGRPGRVMPGFPDLSAAEVNAIIEHIRGWHDGKRPHFADSRIEGNAEHGRALFSQHCAQCHGDHGQGGHGTGVTFSRPRDLPIMPPALNNPGFLTAASDAMIKATLENGRAGTPMVSFRQQGLSDQDLNDLVAYIRSFAHSATPSPSAAAQEEEPAILVEDSPYSLKETVEAVKRAAVNNNFRIIREQHLDYGLVPADQENPHEVIVYFCNFGFLNDALKIDPRVGMFLPCRVTVVERDGKVQVMAINPKRLSKLFNNEELNQACDKMYELYNQILDEATF